MNIQVKNIVEANLGDVIITKYGDVLILGKTKDKGRYFVFDINTNTSEYSFETSENLIQCIIETRGIERIIKAKDLSLVEK